MSVLIAGVTNVKFQVGPKLAIERGIKTLCDFGCFSDRNTEVSSCEDDIIFSAQSPFHEQAEKNTRDFRIKYLKKYISQTYNKTSNIKPEDHLEICKLWMKIESFIKY